jgi:Glyoxalase-like domain
MTNPWTMTFDCENASAQARFWATALGYVESPPPEGSESWLTAFSVPRTSGMTALRSRTPMASDRRSRF